MRSEVLGFPVDILSRQETLEVISGWIKKSISKPKMVVTAYSEFYVTATKDREFGKIISKADLVTPDGVSVLASVEYMKRMSNSSKHIRIVKAFSEGLRVGGKILAGKVGEPVTGVWLFDNLTKEASEAAWKVFLLGGWNEVSRRTAEKLREKFPKIRVEFDAGEERVGADSAKNEQVIKKINAFKPDLLFVQYNPVKQEKWIARNLDRLKVGVAIGVGGTFNEYLGEFKKAPRWMESAGLKWLWRVIIEPQRLGRILRAVVVFPWLVFVRSLSR